MVDSTVNVPRQAFGKLDFEENFWESTREMLIRLYAIRAKKGEPNEGEPKETVSDIVWRVAQAVAIAELKYILAPDALIALTIIDALVHPIVAKWASTFADHIGNQKYWHNTPTNINADPEMSLKVLQYEAHGQLAGLGEKSIDDIWLCSERLAKMVAANDTMKLSDHEVQMGKLAIELKGQNCLAACGVMYADDSLDGIQEAARVQAVAAKNSMGMGINTSSLRPWASIVSNGAGASGPDRFYEKTISSAVAAVAQGGRRGGALMEVRNSDHPDILFFIEKKKLSAKPDFNAIWEKLAETESDKDAVWEKAFVVYGEQYHEYKTKQNYLRNTNISVLAMPGFMEAVEKKQWYKAQFDGKDWGGPVYDPRRPTKEINKNTKEMIYDVYAPDPIRYPEVSGTGMYLQNYGGQGWFYAPDVFDRMVDGMRDSGEPGILFYDTINAANANPHVYDLFICNPCLDGDTFVLTRRGYIRIKELADKSAEIWDGSQWVDNVDFRITARNQQLLEVELESGQSIKATPYHKFILADGTRVEAKNLKPGMTLKSHKIRVHGGKSAREKAAYLKGFLLADGSVAQNNPELWLYENKFVCQERLINSANELASTNKTTNTVQEVGFIGFASNNYSQTAARQSSVMQDQFTRKMMQGLSARRDQLLPWTKEFKSSIPIDAVLNWSIESKCEFIAGIFDGDGSACDTKNGYMYQIWNVSKQFLLDLQMLLISIGVESRLGLGKKAGVTDFKERGGLCETQDCWRLTVSQRNSIKLAKRVTFTRLKSFADRKCAYKVKSTFLKIKQITEAGIADKVYCCTVETNHSFALLACIVGQCGEQILPVGKGKDGRTYMGICNLSSMHAAHKSFGDNFSSDYSYSEMAAVAKVQLRAMDNVIDVSWFPFPIQNLTARLERRTGGGFAGIAEYLARSEVRFGSPEGCAAVENLYYRYTKALVKASEDLAETRGVYPLWEGSVYAKRKQRVRNSCMGNNAPTGTLAPAMQTSWGIDPFDGIVFSRKIRTEKVDLTAPGFDEAMKNWTHPVELKQLIRNNGKSVQNLDCIPEHIKHAYPIRLEITPEQYINHLAAVYKGAAWCPEAFNSVSNTCSIPMHTDPAFIGNAIVQAWKMGVKAITFYPDSSRDSQPVEKINVDRNVDILARSFALPTADQKTRKVDLSQTSGVTAKVPVGMPEGQGTIHITLNHNEESQGAIEVYLRQGKAGGVVSGLCEAVGRLISAFLQFAAKYGEASRAEAEQIIITQLKNIESGSFAEHRFPGNEKPTRILSVCDGVAKTMQFYRDRGKQALLSLKDVETYLKTSPPAPQDPYFEMPMGVVNKLICQDCGCECTKIDGCSVCTSCGSSKCS